MAGLLSEKFELNFEQESFVESESEPEPFIGPEEKYFDNLEDFQKTFPLAHWFGPKALEAVVAEFNIRYLSWNKKFMPYNIFDEIEMAKVEVDVSQMIISPRQIPIFKAEPAEDFDDFISLFERVSVVNGWPPQTRAQLFPAFLQGHAAEVWEELASGVKASWENTIEAMSTILAEKSASLHSSHRSQTLM